MAKSYLDIDPYQVKFPNTSGLPDWYFDVKPKSIDEFIRESQAQEINSLNIEENRDQAQDRQRKNRMRDEFASVAAPGEDGTEKSLEDVLAQAERILMKNGEIGSAVGIENSRRARDREERTELNQELDNLHQIGARDPEAAQKIYQGNPKLQERFPGIEKWEQPDPWTKGIRSGPNGEIVKVAPDGSVNTLREGKPKEPLPRRKTLYNSKGEDTTFDQNKPGAEEAARAAGFRYKSVMEGMIADMVLDDTATPAPTPTPAPAELPRTSGAAVADKVWSVLGGYLPTPTPTPGARVIRIRPKGQ